MSRQENTLTYKQSISRSEAGRIFKAIVMPIAIFGFGLFTISTFGAFGAKLIAPLSGLMWAFGLIVAILLPAMRGEVLNQTMSFCVIYFATELGFKFLLGLISGASSEMISASFNQAIPTATGNALPGYIQTALWMSTAFIPIGFFSMQGKRLIQFRKNRISLEKAMARERDMRGVGRDRTKSI